MIAFKLKEGLIELIESNISNQLTILCKNMVGECAKYPEIALVEGVLKQLNEHDYLPQVKKFRDNIAKIVYENHNRFLLESTIFDLERTKGFGYRVVLEKLNTLSKLGDVELTEGVKQLEPYNFIPQIQRLHKAIAFNETGFRPSNNIKISTPKSIVHMVGENKILFNIDNIFYELDYDNKEVKAVQEQVNPAYIQRLNLLKQSVVEGTDVYVNFNRHSIRFSTINEDIYLNKKKVEGSVFKTLHYSLGMNSGNFISALKNLYEHKSDIISLDFVKTLQPNNNTKKRIHLFEIGENLYVNKVDDGYKISIFEQMSSEQASDCIKLELNHDISESLKIFRDKESEMKSLYEAKKTDTIERIKFLREQKAKLQISENKNQTVKEAFDILNEEEKLLIDELDKISNKVNVSVDESMGAKGFVKGTVVKNHGAFVIGQQIFVNPTVFENAKGNEYVDAKLPSGVNTKVLKGIVQL